MKEIPRKYESIINGLFSLSLLVGCSPNDPEPMEPAEEYIPTPKPLSVPPILEQLLPPPYVPADNPQTVEGMAFGRKLFFDPILSGDGTQACASCHKPSNSFTDDEQFSIGIDGIEGTRNSMPLYNMAWNDTMKNFSGTVAQ